MVDDDDLIDELLDADEDDEEGEEGEAEERGRSSTLTFITGMVLGGLVGAAVALLVAPERGEITRKKLKRFARRFRHDASERLEDVRDAVGKELARRKKRMREQIEERI
jgi:gas vesicle protein